MLFLLLHREKSKVGPRQYLFVSVLQLGSSNRDHLTRIKTAADFDIRDSRDFFNEVAFTRA